MQHDIYSLGVCLLEIGLWKSFVRYDAEGGIPVLSPFFETPSNEQLGKFAMNDMKRLFISTCRTKLPRHMGQKYANVVETCLTCLDAGNMDFGDEEELTDQDGILVGVRYIEKVRVVSDLT